MCHVTGVTTEARNCQLLINPWVWGCSGRPRWVWHCVYGSRDGVPTDVWELHGARSLSWPWVAWNSAPNSGDGVFVFVRGQCRDPTSPVCSEGACQCQRTVLIAFVCADCLWLCHSQVSWLFLQLWVGNSGCLLVFQGLCGLCYSKKAPSVHFRSMYRRAGWPAFWDHGLLEFQNGSCSRSLVGEDTA